MKALMASDEVDAVVPVLLQRSALMPEVTKRIVVEQENARAAGSRKPIHVCWVAPEGAEDNRRHLLAAGIPCHPSGGAYRAYRCEIPSAGGSARAARRATLADTRNSRHRGMD